MTRLPGWSYARPRPRRLPGGRRVRRPPARATPPRSARRWSAARRCEQVSVHGSTAAPVRRQHDRGTWRADNVVIATGPHGTPARARRPRARDRRAHRPARTATPASCPRRRPRGRGLGLRRADRRRAQPGGPRGRPRRRAATPGCRAATAAWTSSGGWSTGRLVAHHRRGPRPGGCRREPSLQLVGRNDPGQRPSPRPGRAAGARRPAGRPLRRVARTREARFGDDLPSRCTQRTRGMHGLLDAVDDYVAARGLSAEVLAGSARAPVDVPTPVALLDLVRERIGTVRARDRLPARPPVAPAAGHGAGRRIRQYRGVTAAPGVYIVGQRVPAPPRLGLHRRRPARRRTPSSPTPARAATRPPVEPPRSSCDRASGTHDGAATTSSSSAAGSPAPRPPCCSPAPASASRSSTGGVRRRHRFHPRPDARRRAAAVPVGPARPQSSRPGTPPIRGRCSTTPTSESVQVSIRPSPASTPCTRRGATVLDRILVDAAAEAGAEVLHGTTVTDLLPRRHGGRVGWRGRARTPRRRHRRARRARFTVGADGIRSVVAQRAGHRVRPAGPVASAVLYRYFAGLAADGYEWAYGDGSGAGLDPDQRRPDLRLRLAPPRSGCVAARVGRNEARSRRSLSGRSPR